jgi:hypothetical protein
MTHFWNGNKSVTRQKYEYDQLELLLTDSQVTPKIKNDLTDYPLAQDEGAVFENDVDLLVTVAGNKKFDGKRFLEIKSPLCKGLLGWRSIIIAKHRSDEFLNITVDQLKQKVCGVPATWVDADLFRDNGFKVLEQGNLEDMLDWIETGHVDFITLGVTEAEQVLASRPEIIIEPSAVIYYPFPLVYYVNEKKTELAARLEKEIQLKSRELDELFYRYFGDVLESVKRTYKKVIVLENSILPDGYDDALKGFR